MLYINKDTGIVLDFDCAVSGGSWEPVKKPSAPKKAAEKPKGRVKKPDGKLCND